MYQVKIYKKAIKSLEKIPVDYQNKFYKLVGKLKESPFGLDLKKLHQPHYASHRLRVGDYRVFLDINTSTKIVIIIDIERRTTQTYR